MFIYRFTYIFKCQLKQLIIWIRNEKMCCKTAYKWRVSVLKQPAWRLQPDMIHKSEVGFFYIFFSIAAQHTTVPGVQYVTYKCLVSFMVTLIYNHAGWWHKKPSYLHIYLVMFMDHWMALPKSCHDPCFPLSHSKIFFSGWDQENK